MTETWPARAAKSALEALMLPGDVYAGRVDPMSDEGIGKAADLAGLVMGGAYGMAPAGSVGVAGARSASRLPMDEASRMSRAAEQGYMIDAYKGMMPYHPDGYPTTNGYGKVIEPARMPMTELTEIRPPRHSNYDDPISSGSGFFSSSPDVASRFAELFGSGAVYPVKLRMQNPKVIDAQGRHAADFQFGAGAGQLRLPKDSPHDGVILKNTKDEGDVYIPAQPQQIRSKFAAFDPANKDSSHLLGAGSPLSSLLMQAIQAQAAQ